MSPIGTDSEEYPPKADLRNDVCKPLPKILTATVDPGSMTSDRVTTQARVVVDAFNAALASNNVEELSACFYTEQSFWRDTVALTSHLRTFSTPRVVAAALLKMITLRGIVGKIDLSEEAHFVVISPTLMFIDCGICFLTGSPALECLGRILLLPAEIGGVVSWKIWVLSTWVKKIVHRSEDETLLRAPARSLKDLGIIETDVVIIGGGSSGLGIAARLKALGVESVILERNAQIGDNWGNRYDSLSFHIPTSICEMPYTQFRKELQSPHHLTKSDLVDHLRQYSKDFHLNVLLSATIQSSAYSLSEKKWTIEFGIGNDNETKIISSKHLVQATGIGCGKPYLPPMQDENIYKGISLHSSNYRNTQLLVEKGVKSVAIIGSACSAFDIMEDCYKANFKTTMVARSPTHIIPYDYVMDPHGVGIYDRMPVDAADRQMSTLPLSISGQFAQGLFAHLASQEPDRYLALSKAGFPVLDNREHPANLEHILIERAGGHYVDVGGTKLISEGKVSVRGLVQPVGYTETGLRLSDGSTLDVDAVIWCTGFADKDVRTTVMGILGSEERQDNIKAGVLGPADIVARLDASWGVDAEGEVRGVWKRHLRMENYWVMAGAFPHQRVCSRPLAQQIKLALEGILPPAYRDTPSMG